MFACYFSIWDSTSLIDRPRSQTVCLAFSLPASFWITGSQQHSWWSLAVFASFCFLCFFFLSLCRVHRVGFALPCVRLLVGFDPVIATLQLGDRGHLGDNLERILMQDCMCLNSTVVRIGCVFSHSHQRNFYSSKIGEGHMNHQMWIHLGQMPGMRFLFLGFAMSGCYLVVREDSPVTENKMPCMKLSSRLLIARPGFLGDGANHTDNKPRQFHLSCCLTEIPPLHTRKIEIWMTMSQKRKWLDNMNWRGIWWDNFPTWFNPQQSSTTNFPLGSVHIFFCGPSFVNSCKFIQTIWLDKLLKNRLVQNWLPRFFGMDFPMKVWKFLRQAPESHRILSPSCLTSKQVVKSQPVFWDAMASPCQSHYRIARRRRPPWRYGVLQQSHWMERLGGGCFSIICWVWLPPRKSGKWRFRLGIPY